MVQMRARLENIQRLDFMERDRIFYKRQITAFFTSVETARKRVWLLQSQKDAWKTRRFLLRDDKTFHRVKGSSVSVQRMEALEGQIKELEKEQGVLGIMKKNYEFFLTCLKELPETNPAGMPLKSIHPGHERGCRSVCG